MTNRRAVIGWLLFDFANSSYTTVIVTVAFAVYFREAVVDSSGNSGDQLWGVANFLAMLIVALTAPIAGAIADEAAGRKRFLVATSLLTVTATALMYFVEPGRVVLAITLYVLATVGFEAGYVFYNAFLPDVADEEHVGRVSAWGWGLGYIGGMAALLICAPWLASELRGADGAVLPAAAHDRRFAFLVTAGFYLLFALPAFLWLRDTRPATTVKRSPSAHLREGFRRVLDTLGHIRRYRDVARFVLASLLFNDGISTVIMFSGIYATVTFGFGGAELTTLFIVMNLVAFPTTVVAGFLADRFGSRGTLAGTLVLWIAIVLFAGFARSAVQFWIVAISAAAGMGSAQTVARSLMAQLCPPEREAEFFGFYVTSGKFAAVFGPLVFGVVSATFASQRLAVLSLLPLFVGGLTLVLSIDMRRARHAAGRGSTAAVPGDPAEPGCPG